MLINIFLLLLFLLFKSTNSCIGNNENIFCENNPNNKTFNCCSGLICKHLPIYGYKCFNNSINCINENEFCETNIDGCCYGSKCTKNNKCEKCKIRNELCNQGECCDGLFCDIRIKPFKCNSSMAKFKYNLIK
ncbi:hypothetical protein Mgra_00010154 [Meloidogyne graminicola]|uniref:Uncharacterized protein n=1 Tax=Meloidogyne graminicola TaxID=189291 RepID=A0A8S9Z5Y9_9BILA|nr:hypothetical protein Mgra_00010154 [Meloidogyne graminicola]